LFPPVTFHFSPFTFGHLLTGQTCQISVAAVFVPPKMKTASIEANPPVQTRAGVYRWTICGLLFFATTINYIDRQTISVLAPDLQHTLNWNELDYGNIIAAALISLAAAAHQGWSANLFTLSSDLFPQPAVGSVIGMAGGAGACGFAGFILQTTKSYVPLFLIAGTAYLIAFNHYSVDFTKPAPGASGRGDRRVRGEK
jgi:nitrate/nitrite transporter NarK